MIIAIIFVKAKSTPAIRTPTRLETKITAKVNFIASWRVGQMTFESSTFTSLKKLTGLTLAMSRILAQRFGECKEKKFGQLIVNY